MWRPVLTSLSLLLVLGVVSGFKTGLEEGLICNVCVGTHPGCGLYDFDYRWYWGKVCPRWNDKCVKLIERRGAEVLVTRDCLSSIESFRIDVPADKYEGCRPASRDVKLGQYVFNRIKELDVEREYFENTTYCFCDFDHWCNSAPHSSSPHLFIMGLVALLALFIF